ncbi:MAG: hypothetical protein AAFP78_00690, partial [Pseudomonadota bacterium]
MAQLAPGAAFAPDLGAEPVQERTQLVREYNQLNKANKNNRSTDELRKRRRQMERRFRRDVGRRILTPMRSP